MGRTSYVQDDIAKGRLVVPFEIKLPVDAGFYLVSAVSEGDSPKLSAFRNWLAEGPSQAEPLGEATPPMRRSSCDRHAKLAKRFDGRSLPQIRFAVIGGGNAALCAGNQRAGAPAPSVLVLEGAPKFYSRRNTRHTRKHALRPWTRRPGF